MSRLQPAPEIDPSFLDRDLKVVLDQSICLRGSQTLVYVGRVSDIKNLNFAPASYVIVLSEYLLLFILEGQEGVRNSDRVSWSSSNSNETSFGNMIG